MTKIYRPSLVYLNGHFEENQAVVTEQGTIIEIGNTDSGLIEKYPHSEQIDWKDKIMIPGAVNVHNHSFQSLLRGIGADRPFLEWRDAALYKFSPYLKAKDLYTGAAFAFSEMIKCGVTTVSDFFYVHNDGLESDEAVIQAAKDVGIRLVLARTMYDWNGAPSGYVETIEEAVQHTKQLAIKYASDDMIHILPAPHSLHAASLEMIKAGHKLAQELDTKFHIHVAEEPFEVEQVQKAHHLRPVELLHQIGVMNDQRMVAIHCVWLNQHEIELMGQSGAQLAYCPSSNMFLADGITNIPKLLSEGVNIGLGTDGACSNNRISVFEEMRMCALLQKVHTLDSTSVNYKQVFAMGTENGGELLQLPTGKIKVGYSADFVAINKNHLSVQPLFQSSNQLLANLVYSMQPNAIDCVVVQDEIRVENDQLTGLSEKRLITSVNERMAALDHSLQKNETIKGE